MSSDSSDSSRRLDLSKIRHDLRTPVNHILGYCEMLQESEETPAEFQADLKKIHTGGRQLLALIREYFDEEIFETKQHDLHQLSHNLRTPVNHIIGFGELLQEEAEAQGKAELVADIQRITDAAHRWLGLMEEYLVTPGADPSEVAQPATGLLPQGIGFTSPAPTSADMRRVMSGHVLVADDDESNREMLSRRLRRQGLEVSTAATGLEAIQFARKNAVDLILLDMVMPGLDGYQVLSKLKSDPALASIPVIMISALDQDASIARCIEIGAEDYVAKPFNAVFLTARISACLEKKRLREKEATYLKQIHEEKQRSDDLLHVILPNEVATELKATNQVKPRRVENVGVLFCDIVGFTAYSESQSAETVLSHLGPLIEAFEQLAVRFNLEKIKTVGDAFMAAAGLSSPLENPGLHCARCGLEMVAAAGRLPPHWQVRIGLHVGPVVAGVVGRLKYQYDIWGDTVNTAARMAEVATPNTVCVNAETWRWLTGFFQAQARGAIEVKGKGAQEVFELSAARAAASK